MVENFEDEIEEESELALMAQFLSDETLHCLTGGTTALIFQVRGTRVGSLVPLVT